LQDLVEGDAPLEPGQGGAEAEVDAVSNKTALPAGIDTPWCSTSSVT
jgi:hypothetical protein